MAAIPARLRPLYLELEDRLERIFAERNRGDERFITVRRGEGSRWYEYGPRQARIVPTWANLFNIHVFADNQRPAGLIAGSLLDPAEDTAMKLFVGLRCRIVKPPDR